MYKIILILWFLQDGFCLYKTEIISWNKIKISHFGNYVYLCKKEKKLRVIAKKILRNFLEKHGDCGQELNSSYEEADKGTWKDFYDRRNDNPDASILADDRMVVNIQGYNC